MRMRDHSQEGCESKLVLHLPTTAHRCRSQTEKIRSDDLFSSVLLQFKKYRPSGNLKFNNLGIFQSLKFRVLVEKKSFQFREKIRSEDLFSSVLLPF